MEKQKSVYNLLQSLYRWDSVAYSWGLTGKYAGSIDVAAKMENVVCFLHGPEGSALLSYRLTAHRRLSLPRSLYASDLEEKDCNFWKCKKAGNVSAAGLAGTEPWINFSGAYACQRHPE